MSLKNIFFYLENAKLIKKKEFNRKLNLLNKPLFTLKELKGGLKNAD